jgi:hypothetical protein
VNCNACGTANLAGARFCASCGNALPIAPPAASPKAFGGTVVMGQRPDLPPMHQGPQAPMPQQPMLGSGPAICASCGAAFVAGKCDRCGGTQGTAVPSPTTGIHWVQVRLSIKCMQCQQPSPLSRIDTDGRFYCYSCGREQLFDADIWKESVFYVGSALGDAYWANAHVFPPWPPYDAEKADLTDTDPFDEINADLLKHTLRKCQQVGQATGGLTVEQSGMSIGGGGMRTRGVAVAMSPGHPLCTRCKTPLETTMPADGVVAARCSRCGTSDAYRLPGAAKVICSDVSGVLSPEHVEGRDVVRIASAPGSPALAITCPKCGSGLQLAPGERLTNCPYCKTTALVPDHVASAGKPAPTNPDPLWLAFRTPSSVRNAVVASSNRVAKEEAAASAPSESHDLIAEKRAERERYERQQAQRSRFGIIAGVGMAAATVAVIAAVEVNHHKDKDSNDKRREGNHGAVATPTSTKSAKPVKADPVVIPSCMCSFGDGQSTPQITLTVQAPPSDGSSRSWLLGIERTSGFMSESRSARFPSQPGAVLPPAADAGAPARMGIACDTGLFVLVADKAATGWSSVNGAWKWNATLPASLTDGADASTPVTAATDYTGGCTPLLVKSGVATLGLANGKHVSLSLKDGKLH